MYSLFSVAIIIIAIFSADTSLGDAWQKCRVQIAGLDIALCAVPGDLNRSGLDPSGRACA